MAARDDSWLPGALAAQDAYRGPWPEEYGPPSPPDPWAPSMGRAKEVGASLIDMARTAPGHAARGLMSGIASLGVPPDPIPFGDTSEEFDRRGLEGAEAARKQLAAATYEPQTMAGHYMGSVAEVMGNPLNWAGPGTIPFKAGFNVASGVGGEAGAQAAKGTPYEGAARLAGSFSPIALERGWAATGPLVRAMPGGSVGAFGGKIVQPQPQAPMGELAQPFYSAAEQAVTSSPLSKAPAAQWLGTLRNAPGVKPEELQRLGVEPWLGQQAGPVSRQQLADYVAANRVNLGEVVRSGSPRGGGSIEDALMQPTTATKFSSYQLPGGENYRETLLTLPDRSNAQMLRMEAERRGYGDRISDWPDQAFAQRYRNEITNNPRSDLFTGSHWDEPNVLAHYRTNDRVIDGKKTLFLEEVQSDWHQKGRKQGYREDQERELANLVARREQLKSEFSHAKDRAESGRLTDELNAVHDRIYDLGRADVGVPDAPFKTTWPELTMKRAIREAAEGGYDQIAWTPGKVQAERYDLSKQVSGIRWEPSIAGKDESIVRIDPHNGPTISLQIDKNGNVAGSQRGGQFEGRHLSDVVGKEVADKIVGKESGFLKDLDLQVGGEGMKGFYDKMLPAAANKIGKKHGAEVGQAQMFEGAPNKWEPFQRENGQWTLRNTDDGYIHSMDYPSREAAAAVLSEGKSHTVHTLPITPQLRETALRKGFPLFQLGAGGVGLGALAAQDRYQPNEL
jgi:hypothetical protein